MVETSLSISALVLKELSVPASHFLDHMLFSLELLHEKSRYFIGEVERVFSGSIQKARCLISGLWEGVSQPTNWDQNSSHPLSL